MVALTIFETGRNRPLQRRSVILGVVAGLCLTTAHAHGQDSRPAGYPTWRGEVQAHGAWLPGQGTRGGGGVGVAARYRWVTLGAEVWRYRLTLDDELSGERIDFGTTIVVPAHVGLLFTIPRTRFLVGGGLGLGFNTTGPTLKTGYCAKKYYGPWVGMVRGFIGASLGHHLIVGPHVAYLWDASGAGGDSCGTGPSPDPELKVYPHKLPMGVQVGLSLIGSYP